MKRDEKAETLLRSNRNHPYRNQNTISIMLRRPNMRVVLIVMFASRASQQPIRIKKCGAREGSSRARQCNESRWRVRGNPEVIIRLFHFLPQVSAA